MTGRTFFTGCTHFGHERIIGLASRPFDSVEEMDMEMVDRWNRVVRDQDTVYHLGDFSYKAKARPLSYRDRLRGRIIFIQGNHDPEGWGREYLEVKVHEHSLVLFHYPIEEWNGWWRKSLHFHCHTHDSERFFGKWSAERRFNVTVELHDYRPVEFDEVIESAKEEGWI